MCADMIQKVVESQLGKPGERLRIAREAKGLTQDAVAEKIHLGVEQVKAIENDDYNYVSSLAYARGHLRLYARFVDLSANEVLKAFDALGLEKIVPPPKKPDKIETEEKYSPLTRWWSLLLVLILLILMLVWWRTHLHHGYKAPAGKNATQLVVPATTSSANSGRIPLPIPPATQQALPAQAPAPEVNKRGPGEPEPQWRDTSQE